MPEGPLRSRPECGWSGLLRNANMKTVPGLVTMISSPSNLTSMSILQRNTYKGAGPKPTPLARVTTD